jgi:hypothetical protein
MYVKADDLSFMNIYSHTPSLAKTRAFFCYPFALCDNRSISSANKDENIFPFMRGSVSVILRRSGRSLIYTLKSAGLRTHPCFKPIFC